MPTHPPAPVPSPTATLLARAAELVDQLPQPATPVLVGLVPAGADPAFELRPLEGHPVDELLGFHAPAHWSAVGVAARGTARRLDPDDGTDGPGGPVRVVHLVARDGTARTRVVAPGGAVLTTETPAAGPVDDVCRRSLVLPTPPPERSVLELLARWWLDEVLLRADSTPGPFTWATVAAAHPLQRAAPEGRPGPDVTASTFPWEDAVAAFAADHPWAVLRSLACGGVDISDELTPHQAAWFDDGAYARWCLGRYPELGDLVAAVATLAPRPVVDRVVTTLIGWGLWPDLDTDAASA